MVQVNGYLEESCIDSGLRTIPVRMEDEILRQIDRALFLRSMGRPWGRAVAGLRSACVGLETPAFATAWEKRPVTFTAQCYCPDPEACGHEIVETPTEADLDIALNLLMQLLVDREITFKRNRTWRTTPVSYRGA